MAVNNLPAMQETQARSLGHEDLEKGVATHFSVLDQGTFTRPYGWEGPSRLPCPPGLACGETAQRERLLGQTSLLSDSVYGPFGRKVS